MLQHGNGIWTQLSGSTFLWTDFELDNGFLDITHTIHFTIFSSPKSLSLSSHWHLSYKVKSGEMLYVYVHRLPNSGCQPCLHIGVLEGFKKILIRPHSDLPISLVQPGHQNILKILHVILTQIRFKKLTLMHNEFLITKTCCVIHRILSPLNSTSNEKDGQFQSLLSQHSFIIILYPVLFLYSFLK